MKYLIVGASSGLGRKLAYTYAENKHDLILVSRDAKDLEAIKTDLTNRYHRIVETVEIDLSSIDDIKKKLLISKYFDEVSGILFPIGMMLEEDFINTENLNIIKLLNANFLSITLIINSFAPYLLEKEGQITGFGSVSGYLGRDLNPYYSASKRALESYFESLYFFYKNFNIKMQFYILGYIDTNLSFGKKIKLPLGSINELSELVYKNKEKKFKIYFFPKWWILIVFILKILPIKILILFHKIFR